MDAAELARWTRFAAKGGIGKCIATRDCIAESADDLMFLKDDDITVLMQLTDQQNLFLGYCEGVVGRFLGSDVHFLSRLKKPVMTKRSSVSSSSQSPQSHLLAKSPTPTFNKSPSPRSRPGSPALVHRTTLTGSGPRASIDSQIAMGISVPETEKEPQKLGSNIGVGDLHSTPPLFSSAQTPSTFSSSGSTWSGVILSEPESIQIHQPGGTLHPSIPALSPAPIQPSASTPPTIFLSGSPPRGEPRLPLPQIAIASTNTISDSSSTSVSASRNPPPATFSSTSASASITAATSAAAPPYTADTSASTFNTTFDSARISSTFSDSDGAVGIGLSLLQDLMNGDGSSDDESDSDGGARGMHGTDKDSIGEVAESPSWMRSRTPSPSVETQSRYSESEEGDSMRTAGPNDIEELEEDERLHYGDDEHTEQGHGVDYEQDDQGVDQDYSDEEYEEDEETTEGFDLNLGFNILSSSPSTSTSGSSPPKSHPPHRPSPLQTTSSASSSSASPPPSASPQRLTFPPVAPLSPQRYRSFRQQQQLQFNFPAPPTHTPLPVPAGVPFTPTRTSGSIRSSTSSSSSPRSPHLPPPGLASHPTSPLSASFPFPGQPRPMSSDDGEGRDRDRERRPSFASHFSNTTGTAGSDWDGAGDIYDDYRYSRSSMSVTTRTMSAASAVQGRDGSRRVSAGSGSRRTSAGSRRTSVGSSHRRASGSAPSSARMNTGEMEAPPPPPFVDNPEARMRADSGTQQIRTSSMSSMTTSMVAKPEHDPMPPAPSTVDVKARVSGVPSSDENSDGDLRGHHQTHAKNTSNGEKLSSRHSKFLESSLSDDDGDDVSVYTQSSISHAQHSRMSSNSAATSSPNSTSTSTPAASTATSPRPTPLSLVAPNGQPTTGPSPLLHTTWGSPVPSSNPAATPSEGRGGYTPLFAGGLDALSRALAAGVAAVVGTKAAAGVVEGEGGTANAPRQRMEVVRRPSPPLVLNSGVNTNVESHSRDDGLGEGRGIVIEDEEDVSPASPVSLRRINKSPSGSGLGIVIRDSPEPEPEPEMVVKRRFAPLVVANRTPSPADTGESTEEEIQDQREKDPLKDASPPVVSPLPRTEPTEVAVVPLSNTAATSLNDTLHVPPSPSPFLSPPSAPPSPAPSPLPSPSPSPSHLRPSLLELRGVQPGAGQGQRRSLFLPHPNAPKAPSSNTSGPMYITQQQPPPPQLQAQSSVVQIIRQALVGQNRSGRLPTIYGRTHVDLAASVGPVLMTFSVDPPPVTVPSPAMNVLPGRMSPSPSLASGRGSLVPEASGMGANSPERRGSMDPHQRGSVIPRANFFPKAGGARPRSRSFSGFNSQSTEVPLPVQRSREEGSQTHEMPSVNEVRRSLSPAVPLSPNLSPSPTKPSSLRVSSPLALSQHNTVSFAGSSLSKPPSSPLAQTTTLPPSPPTSIASNRPPHQLRQIVSKADMNEPPPLKPRLVTRTTLSGTSISSDSVPTSPVFSLNQGRDVTPDTTPARRRPSADTDGASLHSTRSSAISPPLVTRHPSLRTKLSLPNLRRNISRQDDNSSVGSVSQQLDGDTLQVQDMDFELVRPSLSHLQPKGPSEDSSPVGRDGLTEFKYPSSLRADSPAVSTSSARSPIISDASSPTIGLRQPINVHASSESESSMDAHRQREQKWMSVLSAVPPAQSKKSKKVKKLLMEGVPSSVRYLVWTHLTDGKARCVPGVYAQLGARGRVPAFVEIERDVQRCFNDHPHLQSMHGSILSLLQAYLTMVPDIQYTTGLTLIAGQLLLLAPEEDAFWIFISVMDTHLRPYFSSSTRQIEVDSTLFSRALENIDSVLAKKVLMEMSISPSAICRPWFTSLFVGSLPLEHLNRVWDIFLLEGVPFLIRVGLVLLSACRRQILDATSEATILRHLSHPHLSLLPPTADAFISLAFSVKLKDDDIRKQRVKMEAQVKRQTQTPRLVSSSASISLPRN